MVNKNKNVFWQALLVALLVFWLGILIGVVFERTRSDRIQTFYFDSETDLSDFETASEVVFGSNLNCLTLNDKAVIFADKIYNEAQKLEEYDDSNKLTAELISLHRRYDVLRTSLWQDIIESKKNCPEKINTVVYFYDYINPSLTTKAVQGTMSNLLYDLKGEYGDGIILIPVAYDTGVQSLDLLRKLYNIKDTPTILVNEKQKFETIDSLKNVNSFLKNVAVGISV